MKAHDLVAILDFLYQGEANVFQDNLDSFLAIAEELQLKGLMGKTEDFGEDKKPLPSYNTSGNVPESSFKRQLTNKETRHPSEGNSALAIPTNFSGNFDELEAKVCSLMEKSQNKIANGTKFAHRCTVCGKEGQSPNIKDHIEANHLEGVIITCNLCERTFRSRNALRLNNKSHHTTLLCVVEIF